MSRPLRPSVADSTEKPSRVRRVSRESRMPASSSMMRMLAGAAPGRTGAASDRLIVAASDMYSLSGYWLGRGSCGAFHFRWTRGEQIGCREFEAELGAFADGAVDVDLAGVLLHDAVGDGEAEAGAFALAFLGGALGGEEGVVDAAEGFGGHAGTVVGDADFDDAGAVLGGEGDAAGAAVLHGVLGVHQEVDENLLELAEIALNGREIGFEVECDFDAAGAHLMLKERGRVADHGVDVDAGDVSRASAREVEQAVDDFGSAEGLLGDLVEDRGEVLAVGVRFELLGEHLGVAGDDGEGGVDLMRDAGGEKTDGGKFFRLGELRFEVHAVGEVVDDDDAADSLEVAVEQRRDGDVGGAGFAGGGGETEFVDGAGALFGAQAVEAVEEVGGEDFGERAAQGFGAREGVHDFHLRVPALDAVLEVDGEDADVDGLDDVFVEVLEALEVGDLLLEAAVELGVLDGDADVTGEGFEEFDVFGGEKVSIVGAAEADDGDCP